MIKKKKKKRVNKNRDEKQMLLTKESPFLIQEAYKALRTNVVFSLPESDTRVIGVTSSEPGAGKSMNAINLAISFGQIGKKVILLECDLRLPTIAAKLEIDGYPGITDLLVGETSLGEVVKKVDQYGIYVIPAGSIPPESTVLLESRQMQKLIQALKKYYQYIIIDLPPIATVVDAAIMSKHIDGFLLVARNDHSEHRAIAQMLNTLRLANAKIIGFVFNDASIQSSHYYGKYYKYHEQK